MLQSAITLTIYYWYIALIVRALIQTTSISCLSVQEKMSPPPLRLWGFFKDLLSSIQGEKDGWCSVLYRLWSPSSQNVWFMNKIDYFIFAHTKKNTGARWATFLNLRVQPALFLLPLVLDFSCSLFVSSTLLQTHLPSSSFSFFCCCCFSCWRSDCCSTDGCSAWEPAQGQGCTLSGFVCSYVEEESVSPVTLWNDCSRLEIVCKAWVCVCVCDCTMRQVVGEEAAAAAAAACGV